VNRMKRDRRKYSLTKVRVYLLLEILALSIMVKIFLMLGLNMLAIIVPTLLAPSILGRYRTKVNDVKLHNCR